MRGRMMRFRGGRATSAAAGLSQGVTMAASPGSGCAHLHQGVSGGRRKAAHPARDFTAWPGTPPFDLAANTAPFRQPNAASGDPRTDVIHSADALALFPRTPRRIPLALRVLD